MISTEETQKLVLKASEARKNAYIYSAIPVGAAIMTENGEIFQGCNIETTISGLGTCAERVAVDSAVVAGQTKFKAIAVVSEDSFFPCGVCLQYLTTFTSEIDIIASNGKGFKIKKLSDLLPERYISKNKIHD